MIDQHNFMDWLHCLLQLTGWAHEMNFDFFESEERQKIDKLWRNKTITIQLVAACNSFLWHIIKEQERVGGTPWGWIVISRKHIFLLITIICLSCVSILPGISMAPSMMDDRCNSSSFGREMSMRTQIVTWLLAGLKSFSSCRVVFVQRCNFFLACPV